MNVDQIFKKDGPLSKYWPNYLPRPGQVALAKAVEGALKDERHLLAEGPCGTGKSLAYGIPAAIKVLTDKSTVVIATANIALQEQLLKKDLPLIANVMSDIELGDLKFFSRKGMGNYVCLYKLKELTLNPKEAWAKTLWKWVEKSDVGDKEELPVDYHELWHHIAANQNECAKESCRFIDKCYAFRAKEEIERSGPCIVVTNYHLLYADSLVKGATQGYVKLLPDHSVTIADEAHEMADIARSFQGFDISMNSFMWLIRKLGKLIKRPDTKNSVAVLMDTAREFFDDVVKYYHSHSPILKAPLGFGREFLTALASTADLVKKESCTEKDETKQALLDCLFSYMHKKNSQLSSICFGGTNTGILPDLLDLSLPLNEDNDEEDEKLEEGSVYYLEYAGKEKPIRLCSQVIEVQDFIRDHILDSSTLIVTSATLSTNGNFEFIAEELGLDPDEYASLIAPSPFNARNMLVVVPNSFPPPQNKDDHILAVSKTIKEVVTELGGRSMALFTSYRSLEYAAKHLESTLVGIELLVQGKLPRGKVVQRLKENEKSLILATASFWQGIDIPGRSLSCLFIEKFPFAPPTDPVVSYMGDLWLKKTGNSFSSFMNYSVPKAVIALKQGVGRLIRQESDYGVVVLFDNRLVTKNYGAHFECAFPNDHFRSSKISSITKFIQEQDARVLHERDRKEE